MRSRKLFVGVMACITAIIATIMIDDNDYAESAVGAELTLTIERPSLITTESFDVLKYEIEAKVTETEEDTEMTEGLTTEVTTEPVTEETTKKSVSEPKKAKTAEKQTKKQVASKESEKTKVEEPKEVVVESAKAVSDESSLNDTTIRTEIVVEASEELTEDTTTEAVTEEPATEEHKTDQTKEESSKKSMYYNMSEDDIYTFAALIYLEAGSTSYKCQCAVGSVVLNLMRREGKNLHQCIKTPGRFSVASRVYRTKPSATALKVARQLVTSGPTLPSYVSCFRNNHYFSWATPYCHIDNVYFSY